MSNQIPYPRVTPQVAPAQWEIIAIVPIMVLMMVFTIIMKVVERATEPEFVREVRPIAEEIAMAKIAGKKVPKLLTGG